MTTYCWISHFLATKPESAYQGMLTLRILYMCSENSHIFINQLDEEALQYKYFQQDSLTCATLTYLQQFYKDRVISKGVYPAFPTKLRIFHYIFGYLEDKIFKKQFNNLE